WRYEYTGDEQWLREYAYPLLKGSLDFYLSYAKKGADGKYHLDPADAQESYWLVKDPAQDLAALRWGLPLAIRLSEKLKVDAQMRPRWQDLLDNLAPFPVDAERNMIREADLTPTDERHNSENVADYAIYPFGVFGVGKPDWQLARSTFDNRPVQGMGNGWEPAAIAAARLGLGEEASKLLLAHVQMNMRGSAAMWYSPTTTVYPNGQPDVPYYDTSGTDAQTLQEMLLQSQDGIIRLAPAWPERWQAQYRLHARGGFVVTADVDQGQVRYALIESQRGGECVLANPWKGRALVTCGGKVVLSADKTELRFATIEGKTYRLEPAAMPLAKLTSAKLAPKAAEGAKWIGKLPPYPKWASSAYLGIDEQGRTPARAWMLRAAADFAKQLAGATAGLEDLTTGKIIANVMGGDGKLLPVPLLTDGKFGGRVSVPVPNEGYVVVDLVQARQVGAVAWSGDRTALFVAQPTAGFTIETSTDGQTWQMAKDSQKSGAPATGHVEKLAPVAARYVRLRLWGQYSRPVLLDEVAVYGN
ncbi:MAG: glycosyl hydrolase family 95 catalytic domain-containing protein, partial [Bacteroidota bacterium]